MSATRLLCGRATPARPLGLRAGCADPASAYAVDIQPLSTSCKFSLHLSPWTRAHLLQALAHTGLRRPVPAACGRHGKPWRGSSHALPALH